MTNETKSDFEIIEYFMDNPEDFDGYWDICWNINIGVHIILEHEGSPRTVLACTSFGVDKLVNNTLTELVDKFIEDEVKSGDWDKDFYEQFSNEDKWNEEYGHLN